MDGWIQINATATGVSGADEPCRPTSLHHYMNTPDPDPKPLSDAQRQALCVMMYRAFCEIRLLGRNGSATQAGHLADAFHNIPTAMWDGSFSLQQLRDVNLLSYQEQYPHRAGGTDYVRMMDDIIKMHG